METRLLRTAALSAAIVLGLTSCAAASAPPPSTSSTDAANDAPEPAPEPTPEPVVLTGEWTQSNPNNPDNFQSATITDGVIEVYWHAPDMEALYWSGTVDIPADGTTTFTWDSVNDTSKTERSILASSDATKTFTYDNGEISYEVTALGTTMTVRLRQE